MEALLLNLKEYQEMMATDIKNIEEDWHEVYSKNFVLNLLTNYAQDLVETIAYYEKEENTDD